MHLNELIHLETSFEKIIHVLRRHPLTFVPTILLFLVLFLLPIGVRYLLLVANPDIFIENNSHALLILGGSFYYLATIVFFFARFIDYYLDMWIITNHRVVDIVQTGLFARTIAELELYKVQDVRSDVRGIFPTVFNYGDLEIQSAGAQIRFKFQNVRRPHDLRKELIALIREDSAYHANNPSVVPEP